jgi:hypothetical protein
MTTPKLNFHSNEIINKENQYYTQFVEFCKEEYLQIQEIIETIRCVQSIRTDLAMEEVNKKIIKWSCEELN